MVREVGEDRKVGGIWELKENFTSQFQKASENE